MPTLLAPEPTSSEPRRTALERFREFIQLLREIDSAMPLIERITFRVLLLALAVDAFIRIFFKRG